MRAITRLLTASAVAGLMAVPMSGAVAEPATVHLREDFSFTFNACEGEEAFVTGHVTSVFKEQKDGSWIGNHTFVGQGYSPDGTEYVFSEHSHTRSENPYDFQSSITFRTISKGSAENYLVTIEDNSGEATVDIKCVG